MAGPLTNQSKIKKLHKKTINKPGHGTEDMSLERELKKIELISLRIKNISLPPLVEPIYSMTDKIFYLQYSPKKKLCRIDTIEEIIRINLMWLSNKYNPGYLLVAGPDDAQTLSVLGRQLEKCF